MDGFAFDYLPPTADAVQRAAEWPIPVTAAPAMIAWAIAALVLLAGLDLVLTTQDPRR